MKQHSNYRRAAWLVKNYTGPFAYVRACPFCKFHEKRPRGRGHRFSWGELAKMDAAVAKHILSTHPEKLTTK